MDKKIKLFLIISGAIIVLGGISILLLPDKKGMYVQVDAPRPFQGSSTAQVVIEEFSDFQCPACKSAENTAQLVVSKYVDQVKFIYRHFPLTQIHPFAFRAALAVECANDQGKFWEFYDLLFLNQPKFSRVELLSYAEGLGINMESFNTCLDERAKEQVVKADMDEAISRNINATPTFFVNGKIVENWTQLEQVVIIELAKQNSAQIKTE
jgi:protein-disulfide isomerase